MYMYILIYLHIHIHIHIYIYTTYTCTTIHHVLPTLQKQATKNTLPPACHVMTCQGHSKEGLGEEGPFDGAFDSPQSTDVHIF